jgi:hypothetical protein
MHVSHLIFVKPLEFDCYMADSNSINCTYVSHFSVKYVFIIFSIDLFCLHNIYIYKMFGDIL